MTGVRLLALVVWLHSPVSPTPALEQAIADFAPVTAIVAPNCCHLLFISAANSAPIEGKAVRGAD